MLAIQKLAAGIFFQLYRLQPCKSYTVTVPLKFTKLAAKDTVRKKTLHFVQPLPCFGIIFRGINLHKTSNPVPT